MSDKIKLVCEQILNEFETGKRDRILNEMVDAVKKYRIDIDEESLRTFARERVKHYGDTHTFSINKCPKALSSTIKKIAKRKGKIPSELVISIMTAYIEENAPEILDRIEALAEFEKGEEAN